MPKRALISSTVGAWASRQFGIVPGEFGTVQFVEMLAGREVIARQRCQRLVQVNCLPVPGSCLDFRFETHQPLLEAP